MAARLIPAGPGTGDVALSAARSPATPGFPASERLDPYWEVKWPAAVGGVTVSWGGRHFDARVAAGGDKEALKALSAAEREAIDTMLESRWSGEYLRLLSVLAAWRTLTDQQLAAFSGAPSVVGRNGRLLPRLVDTGLVQVGRLVGSTGDPVPVTMVRLDPNGQFWYLERRLTWGEWVATTGCRPWSRALQSDRHDVLSSELSLRVAELTPFPVVLGESFARLADLFGTGVPGTGRRRGDAVWLRADGCRIVVEMVASRSPIVDKLENWARLLSTPAGEGTVVVFVVAFGHDLRGPAGMHQLRSDLDRAARSSMGTVAARVPERMAAVSWEEWFPDKGTMSRLFPTLTVSVPSGPDGDRWRQVDLADPFAVPLPASVAQAAVRGVDDARLLWSVPVWQQGGGERLAEMAAAMVGLDGLYGRRMAMNHPRSRHTE